MFINLEKISRHLEEMSIHLKENCLYFEERSTIGANAYI